MDYNDLLLHEEYIEPWNISKKDQIKFIIRIQKIDKIDSNTITNIQKQLNYIRLFHNKFDEKKIILHLEISSSYFKDRTVVLMLEIMLFYLLDAVKLKLYLNIQLSNKNSFVSNYFVFSFLSTINRKFVNSYNYCKGYFNHRGIESIFKNKQLVASNYRKFFEVDNFNEDDYMNQQILSSDIQKAFKDFIKNEDILDESCSIVDELVDNILCHTHGVGLVDVAVVEVTSSQDNDKYYQFMINVLNISSNCLYTDIKDVFEKNIDFNNRNLIEQSYKKQKHYFNQSNYTEDMFFMVSAFQNGTSTRDKDRKGGTGLNNCIISFSKKAQKNVPPDGSYVYSGNNILLFDHEILTTSNIGNQIAFNKENDYGRPPDEKCITNSEYFLNGTAYNLMFIVKED